MTDNQLWPQTQAVTYFFPQLILSAHWSHEEYHGPVCSTKLWAGERFRQPQNPGEHGGWREASSALWAKDVAGFLAQCTLQEKDKPQRGLAWGRFGWHHSWRAMMLRMKSWKLFTTFTNEKKQQTSVTENSSIPFFYTANSGRVFYRFILNVNIPVETWNRNSLFSQHAYKQRKKLEQTNKQKAKRDPKPPVLKCYFQHFAPNLYRPL